MRAIRLAIKVHSVFSLSFWPLSGQSLVEVHQELKSSVGRGTLNVKEITEVDLDYSKAAAF